MMGDCIEAFAWDVLCASMSCAQTNSTVREVIIEAYAMPQLGWGIWQHLKQWRSC